MKRYFGGEDGVFRIAVRCVHAASPAHSSAAEQSSPELREVATHSLCALLLVCSRRFLTQTCIRLEKHTAGTMGRCA